MYIFNSDEQGIEDGLKGEQGGTLVALSYLIASAVTAKISIDAEARLTVVISRTTSSPPLPPQTISTSDCSSQTTAPSTPLRCVGRHLSKLPPVSNSVLAAQTSSSHAHPFLCSLAPIPTAFQAV